MPRKKTRSHLYNQHIRLEVIKKGGLDLINTPYSDRTFNFLSRWAILAVLEDGTTNLVYAFTRTEATTKNQSARAVMENPKVIYLGLFCLLTLLGLGVLLWWRPSKKKKIKELQKWQKTKAEILKLLNHNTDLAMELHPLTILYQYNIEGKTYKNSRIAFGSITDINYKQDIRLYNILRVKNTINIYYNPRNPKESVICRSGGERDIFFCMALAIMSLLWALCLLIILILSHFYDRPDISPIINFMFIMHIPIIVVGCREQVIYRSKIDPFTEDIRQC